VRGNAKSSGGGGLVRKMEGVVESLVGGMIADGKGGIWAEGKVSETSVYLFHCSYLIDRRRRVR
jgi:hypothetical protein